MRQRFISRIRRVFGNLFVRFLLITAAVGVAAVIELLSIRAFLSAGRILAAIGLFIATAILVPALPTLWKLVEAYWDHLLEQSRLDREHDHRIVEALADRLLEYTEKYYLHLASAIRALEEALERQPPDREVVLFRLANYLYIWGRVGDELPGYFLRNLTAETLVAHCESLSQGLLEEWLTPKGLSHLRVLGAQHRSLVALNASLKASNLSPALERLVEEIGARISKEDLLRRLRVFRIILMHYTNLPYRAWYGEEPARIALSQDDLRLVEDELATLEKDKEISPSQKEALAKDLRRRSDTAGQGGKPTKGAPASS